MSEAYQIPKRQVPARVTLAGRSPLELCLYLASRAARHSGNELPSDLLNGTEEFIPATDAGGQLVVLRREALAVVSVDAEYEPPAAEPEGDAAPDQAGVTTEVELNLDGAEPVRGALSYVRPEGQRRLQDFLNTVDRFFPVRDGDVVHLVNRDRIVSVSPL